MPFKTCSYDCIYCQLGRTTCKTGERKEWVPTNSVMNELKQKLRCRPDYITLTASGEPTLHSHLGEIIQRIRALSDVPVAVLTNGSLLWQPRVRKEVAQADVVLPSLNAGDTLGFRSICRPHRSLAFEQVLEGLTLFRTEYAGQYWLEVFVLDEPLVHESDVKRIAALVRKIRPDRVQLNTVTRPPCETFAGGVSTQTLARLAQYFTPTAEIVAERPLRSRVQSGQPTCTDVFNLLQRRPCRTTDVARGLGLNLLEVLSCLDSIASRKWVERSEHNGQIYYRAKRNCQPGRLA
jgi:wyosine [tRNA(Phe)-imidazoG37] synthetase (radical SAM superfamily)